MKIMLTGGGTGGSVTPLLAIARKIKNKFPEAEFIWLGTIGGPEAELINQAGIKFKAIHSGKWRRYFSFRNILDIFLIIVGFLESLMIIFYEKPDIILSAGGFVSVPAVWAGWILGVPSLIHQQDVIAGLANKLMAPAARKITLTFEKSQESFNKKKTVVAGNPVRPEILAGDIVRAKEIFNLEDGLPTILILGGGTGAVAINNLVADSLDKLVKFCQVIHLTGRDKDIQIKKHSRYHAYEFLTKEMAYALAVSDLVVSRAGMGVLTELSILGKAAIIIPIPDSHQEANAKIFKDKNAAVVLNQKKLTIDSFIKEIQLLLNKKEISNKLQQNIKEVIHEGAAEKIVQEIINIV